MQHVFADRAQFSNYAFASDPRDNGMVHWFGFDIFHSVVFRDASYWGRRSS